MYKAVSPGAINVSLPILDAIALAGRCGFEGIEVDPQAALAVGLDGVRDALQAAKLQNAGFGLPVAFRARGTAYDESLKQFPRLVEAAAKLGADRCRPISCPGTTSFPLRKIMICTWKRLRPAHGFSRIMACG